MSGGAQPMVTLARHVKAGIIQTLRLRGRPGAALTLMCLATYANFEGEAWVSATTMSTLTGRKADNIYLDIDLLKVLGVIELCGREGEKGVNRYRLVTPLTGVTDRKLLPPSRAFSYPPQGSQLPPLGGYKVV